MPELPAKPPRPKPPRAGIGRAKGIPNKITRQLKDMILGALDKAGGEQYLARQAEDNPSAFLTLVGKILPLQVQGDPDAPLAVTLITRRVVDPKSPDDRAGA